MTTPGTEFTPSVRVVGAGARVSAPRRVTRLLVAACAGLVLPAAVAMAQTGGAPRPSGDLTGPGFIKIMLTTVLGLALVVAPSVMPSKRGHQD